MGKKVNNLGKRIKEFRLAKQMSQPKAAVFFGVSMPTICRLEAGKNCSDLTRAKIEQILSQHAQAA